MEQPKFKIGQLVRCVNEKQSKEIIGIGQCDGFHYDIRHYGSVSTCRIPEKSLVVYKKGK